MCAVGIINTNLKKSILKLKNKNTNKLLKAQISLFLIGKIS